MPRSTPVLKVPFFRPDIGEAEIQEVEAVMRSGWLTSGPRAKRFEEDFAAAVGARHAVALNSGTAALHLAAESLGARKGAAVLVPTMTFAATVEVILHLGASPILIDCEEDSLNIDLGDAQRKLDDIERLPGGLDTKPVGIIPVHVGGAMIDMDALRSFAESNGLWVIEDAAHAFPAAWRSSQTAPWRRCGEGSSHASCFSFYANKTITTGEGGMAVTNDDELAERMRIMSLHGLSKDAWGRYSQGGTWDYRILAPGYKYNCTDLAAAIGIHQLRRADEMRRAREAVAERYREAFEGLDEIELPPAPTNRIHAWHLFPLKLRLEKLAIDRNAFFDELMSAGVQCSVHWRPLHLHPFFSDSGLWTPDKLPIATAVWQRLISLPIFPVMTAQEISRVIEVVTQTVHRHRR